MQSWTFGPAGAYTATWDGVSLLTVTLTTGGSFVEAFSAPSISSAVSQVAKFLGTGVSSVSPGFTQYDDLSLLLAPAGATGETFPRTEANAYIASMTSGTLYVSAIPLPASLAINNLAGITGSTAAVTVTHGWYVLLDANRVVRAVTADQTSGGAWQTTFQQVPLPVSASYSTPGTALYYWGVCIVAVTMPTMPIYPAAVGNATGYPPIVCGTSNTAQTTPPALGTTMNAITFAAGNRLYGYTS